MPTAAPMTSLTAIFRQDNSGSFAVGKRGEIAPADNWWV
jgi:hypothetical protein